jgi:CPA2 family monovalent cation:H+ antiporter-2
MAAAPFLFYLAPPVVKMLRILPLPDFMIKGLFPLEEIQLPEFRNHLVIIGKDASAIKLSVMARYNNLQHISIVFDPALAKEKMKNGDMVLYGDAGNEPILTKAHADTADIVVISVGSIIPSMAITEKVRQLNSHAHIIVRSASIQNIEQLYKVGADEVLPEKLEIAIDMFNRILERREVPNAEINRITSHIRHYFTGNRGI